MTALCTLDPSTAASQHSRCCLFVHVNTYILVLSFVLHVVMLLCRYVMAQLNTGRDTNISARLRDLKVDLHVGCSVESVQ